MGRGSGTAPGATHEGDRLAGARAAHVVPVVQGLLPGGTGLLVVAAAKVRFSSGDQVEGDDRADLLKLMRLFDITEQTAMRYVGAANPE